jgi:hypothetical protein
MSANSELSTGHVRVKNLVVRPSAKDVSAGGAET